MSRLDLDALERMEKAATPGPWEAFDPCDACCGSCCTPSGCMESHPCGNIVLAGPEGVDSLRFASAADCELTADLRNAAPALFERARLAERMAEALRFADEQLSWHTDEDARDGDTSPEDMTAHVNGLVLKRARAVLREWDALNTEKGDET